MPETATASTRWGSSPIPFSRADASPALEDSSRSAEATLLTGSVPDGMRSCGVVQSPASDACRAILRTSEDLPEPASPRMVRPRSWIPAKRRGRRTSRQSLSWLVRPAHTLGTFSEPGLKGESSGTLMMISLSP